ncbi:MAG: transposase [Ignavibacteria bacterium]|nr:transposase [Ignavibacteria bacterium]
MDSKSTYRTFDKDFKVNAIKVVLEGTKSMNKIAEELGLSSNTLINWKRDYLKDKENSFPGKGFQKPDDAELTKLRKQLFRVTRERDILKKAIAVFTIHTE